MLTLAEENYLKTIYKLSDYGRESVFTNQIAEKIGTQAASVSDMLKKLSQKELINYEKYHGVLLTDKGKHYACMIIRSHRLWEVFLVEKLQFSWDQVHEVAEQLEHIKSELLIDKLDAFLGHPKNDPHGWPIPDKNGKWYRQITIPLSDLLIHTKVRLIKVEGNDGLLKHLDELKINIGSDIEILNKRDFDGLLEVKVNFDNIVFVSKTVADCLYVQAKED